jgi:AraC-type DNA-binding domain-containing proteins
MENKITPLNWQSKFNDRTNCVSIDNDFILFDNIKVAPAFKYPFKINVTIVLVCTKGTLKGYSNMKSYHSQAPCLITMLPNQILQYESISDDFEGLFVVMSKRFTDELFANAQERLPMFLFVKENPYFSLKNEDLNLTKTYYRVVRKIVRKDNPNRLEIVKHLTLAFFYSTSSRICELTKKEEKSKQDILLENFLAFLQNHCKEMRKVNFYADKLCITPKYLSTVIRRTSGKTAGEWIDEYVMLEAKALLKSTKMTIQQISDELNFPSQSFFGKYFKRLEGVPPKVYREN